jgi:thiol-disulfide isomerase/thioredoxin
MPKKFIVYGREDCHLCEDMMTTLRNLQQEFLFEFERINIDKDKNLIQLYSDRVPVLFAVKEEKELCHYFIDTVAFNNYFT